MVPENAAPLYAPHKRGAVRSLGILEQKLSALRKFSAANKNEAEQAYSLIPQQSFRSSAWHGERVRPNALSRRRKRRMTGSVPSLSSGPSWIQHPSDGHVGMVTTPGADLALNHLLGEMHRGSDGRRGGNVLRGRYGLRDPDSRGAS